MLELIEKINHRGLVETMALLRLYRSPIVLIQVLRSKHRERQRGIRKSNSSPGLQALSQENNFYMVFKNVNYKDFKKSAYAVNSQKKTVCLYGSVLDQVHNKF